MLTNAQQGLPHVIRIVWTTLVDIIVHVIVDTHCLPTTLVYVEVSIGQGQGKVEGDLIRIVWTSQSDIIVHVTVDTNCLPIILVSVAESIYCRGTLGRGLKQKCFNCLIQAL